MTNDMPQPGSEAGNGADAPDTQEERQRLEATLRDLVGRMEHVRARLQEDASVAADITELIALLDTTDARLVLGLNPGDPSSEELQTQEKMRNLHDR